MEKLDGVFDSDEVIGAVGVDAVNHRGERGGLTEPVVPCHQQIAKSSAASFSITGTTGSGKSTTLAAMIGPHQRQPLRSPHHYRRPHRVSPSRQAQLHQSARSRSDTANFSTALRAALRQDPDVILVGEMRDLETFPLRSSPLKTGHLVFSTLHTLDATETIQRIIAVFPPPEQKQIRLQLAATLKPSSPSGLVRRADDKGRVPAVEIMIATGYIRDCIINADKTRLIHDAIGAGTSQYGMQTFDQSLFDLYSKQLHHHRRSLAARLEPGRIPPSHSGYSFRRRRRPRGNGQPNGRLRALQPQVVRAPFTWKTSGDLGHVQKK